MVNFKQAKILMSRSMLGCALALGSIGLSSCYQGNNNYRVTLTVEADGQTYTGSEVQKMTCHKAMDVPGSMDVNRCDIRGEAVSVKVGSRGYLFVLLDGWNIDPRSGARVGMQMTNYVRDIFASSGSDPFNSDSELPESWYVDKAHLPVLAKFDDVNDLQSARIVDPENLSNSFGGTAKLVSLRISRTNEEITKGNILRILPSLKWHEHGYFKGSGQTNINDFPTVLTIVSFIAYKM
jgi:hypothetical protein